MVWKQTYYNEYYDGHNLQQVLWLICFNYHQDREREKDRSAKRGRRASRSPGKSRGGKSWRYSKSKSRSRSPSVDRFGRSKRKDNKAVEEEDDTRAEPGMKTEEMERQRKM